MFRVADLTVDESVPGNSYNGRRVTLGVQSMGAITCSKDNRLVPGFGLHTG